MEIPGDTSVTVDALTEGLLKTKAEAKARAGNVCLLATRSGVIDLFGSSGTLRPDAAVRTAGHSEQRSAAVLRHR
jgi:hypothetical protein